MACGLFGDGALKRPTDTTPARQNYPGSRDGRRQNAATGRLTDNQRYACRVVSRKGPSAWDSRGKDSRLCRIAAARDRVVADVIAERSEFSAELPSSRAPPRGTVGRVEPHIFGATSRAASVVFSSPVAPLSPASGPPGWRGDTLRPRRNYADRRSRLQPQSGRIA